MAHPEFVACAVQFSSVFSMLDMHTCRNDATQIDLDGRAPQNKALEKDNFHDALFGPIK